MLTCNNGPCLAIQASEMKAKEDAKIAAAEAAATVVKAPTVSDGVSYV